MGESALFKMSSNISHLEILLGEFPCDLPFRGGAHKRVTLSLTCDSPRSKHGIPVLKLYAGQTMEFTSSEQTPAGHAARLVAKWLNRTSPDSETRHMAELFLWQWPGIHQKDDGNWHLVDEEVRTSQFSGPMINCHGEELSDGILHSELSADSILDSMNLQVNPYGFCNKGAPCYLLDGCLMCPSFLTNSSFMPTLKKRAVELTNKRGAAVAANNHQLADSCHNVLYNIELMEAKIGHEEDGNND